MSSIISKTNLEKIENIRKYVLKAGIWVLVGGVAMGALSILMGGSDGAEMIAKVMGTMFIVALMLMISVNNFHRVASDQEPVQVFALIGLVSNLVWAVLWTLIVWNPTWYATDGGMKVSLLAKFASAFSYLSALGFIGSNTLSIYEGEKRDIIRPLKITATVCATYEMIYFTVSAFMNFDYSSDLSMRLGALAGFAAFVWVVILIAALAVSKGEKNKRAEKMRLDREKKAAKYEDAVIASANGAGATKSEAELRAEIEEKVRREMIEKEIREKMGATPEPEAKDDSTHAE